MPDPAVVSKSDIRVLHLVDFFGIGGLEKVLKDLVLNSPATIRPSVCTLKGGGQFSADVAARGIPVRHLDMILRHRPKTDVLADICALIRAGQIDIVHCHDLTSWSFGAAAALRTRTRLMTTKHGSFEKSTIGRVLQLKALSLFTDCVVAVSPEVQAELATRYFVSRRKLRVIYNGIAPLAAGDGLDRDTARRKLGLCAGDFVLGTVTRFYPVKNLPMQVRLVDALKDRIPNLKYLVVAPAQGSHWEEIRGLVAARGLESRFVFLGSHNDVPAVLKALDLFVMTSLTEGTSIALLEAMRSPLPVVVSAVGGNRHIVQHGVNGFLFGLDDFDGLLEIVLRLYGQPSLRDEIAGKAAAVVDTFSMQSMISAYQREYFRLLERHH